MNANVICDDSFVEDEREQKKDARWRYTKRVYNYESTDIIFTVEGVCFIQQRPTMLLQICDVFF